jgi:NarL family two-component system response regulator LiaR
MNPIRVFVVDDHSIFRRGLAAMIESEPGLAWAGEATSGQEAERLIPALAPDVVLIDLVMPAMDGVSAIQCLRPLLPHTRFVALSCSLDASLARAALDAGVTGYALKTTDSHDLAAVIRAAFEGRRVVAPEITAALDASVREAAVGADLTRRERNLLALMACGLPNQDISERLNIGLPTVKFHVTNILSKLQVENRTAAVLTALRHGIVVLDR